MTSNERTLLEMLTYCRPAGSKTEQAFVDRFLLSIPGAYQDAYGNVHVERGVSRVLFSAHTDTVHREGGRQSVNYRRGIASVATSRRGNRRNCLGADDTAGCYILRELALANVPGHYVFHYGEERGGIGSSALAEHCGPWLAESFDHAIAFDRRGYGDVITHQFGCRCASDTFANELSVRLNLFSRQFVYAPVKTGVYTDTAEYLDLIPECTNVSVGYHREHSSDETLDLNHVFRLIDAFRVIDCASLPIARELDVLDDTDEFGPYVESDYPVVKVIDRCDYLDPEWELIQRTLARAEGRANWTGE